ncbi:helix-turn-helix domain-containing protein [Nocardia goodfellowii]
MALQDDPKRVGATIRALRIKSRLSGPDLARQVHLSPSHLSNIERAERPCTWDVARRLAKALDVELAAITTESGEDQAG